MTGQENIRKFLEEVIRATFVTISPGELQMEETSLNRNIKDPEGRERMRKYWRGELERTKGHPYANVARQTLRDLDDPDYPARAEQELEARKAEYEAQKQAFDAFMTTHGTAVDYIATLALVSRRKVETPPEEIVFETLRLLNGKMIMGELGAGRETLEATLTLDILVTNAAYSHAQRIGEDPKAYCAKVIADQKDTSIVL